MGSPSSSAVLPAQPARRETLIASVSSAAIRLHVLSFIGHRPFKKIGSTRLFLPSKKTPSGRGTPTSESVLCSVYQVLDTASTQRGLCAALIDPAAKLLRACLLLRFKNPQSGGFGKMTAARCRQPADPVGPFSFTSPACAGFACDLPTNSNIALYG